MREQTKEWEEWTRDVVGALAGIREVAGTVAVMSNKGLYRLELNCPGRAKRNGRGVRSNELSSNQGPF